MAKQSALLSHWLATKTTIKGDEYFMGYSARHNGTPCMGHCQGIVWSRTQGEPSLSLFLLLLLSLLHLKPALREPPLFYYFQTRHFFSENVLSLSLSFWAWRRDAAKKHVGNRTIGTTSPYRALLMWVERERERKVDEFAQRVNCRRGWKVDQIFFRTLLFETADTRQST